jgi:hypothetical protein
VLRVPCGIQAGERVDRDRELAVFRVYIRNLHPEFYFTTDIDLGQSVDGAGYFGSWREKAKTDGAVAALVKRYHERPAGSSTT